MENNNEYIRKEDLIRALSMPISEGSLESARNNGYSELQIQNAVLRTNYIANLVINIINAIPMTKAREFNWQKFPDNKPIAFRNCFVTLDISREVVEAYYDSNKNAWCYPHSFGTKVEGIVIAWAEKIAGYRGE